MGKRASSLFLFAILSAGCMTPVVDDRTAQSTDPIVGGTDDTADPAVVAIYAKVPGAAKGGLCTGEIIAPTVVLTAAHCTMEEEVGVGAVWRVYSGHDVTAAKDADWMEVASVHHDPGFSTSAPQNGHDIGVVILKNPTNITPIPINRHPIPQSAIGGNVRIVGFGLSDGFNQTGAGIKREASVPLNGVDDKVLDTGDFFKKSCNGDSGGPAFLKINGKETIVGVTSYGMIFCMFHGYYTRVDLYSSWLDQYLN